MNTKPTTSGERAYYAFTSKLQAHTVTTRQQESPSVGAWEKLPKLAREAWEAAGEAARVIMNP